MLCQSANHFPFVTEQSPTLTVSRIELFVIPALAVDSAGHRICLRLTSSLGYGWSELFICETEDMIDLDSWSDLLVSFIGRIALPPLHDFHYDKTSQNGRAFELFTTAVNQVLTQSPDSAPIERDAEELVLRQRAVNYVSLI